MGDGGKGSESEQKRQPLLQAVLPKAQKTLNLTPPLSRLAIDPRYDKSPAPSMDRPPRRIFPAMYVVVTYDVEQARVQKVCAFLRRYLSWVQNSVFEGEITEGQYVEMLSGLRKIIRSEYDSVYVFQWPAEKLMRKQVLGQERGRREWLLE